MTHSNRRIVSVFGVSTAVAVLITYMVASSVIAANPLSIVGIGGFFVEAESLQGEEGLIYPQMGRLENSSVTTDSVACEQRPMLAINLQKAEIRGYSIFKDIRLPFTDDRWVSVVVDEPNGRLISKDELTIFNTQLEADWLNLTNVELTEGGLPYQGVDDASDVDSIDRSADYEPPDNLDGAAEGINPARDADDASNEIWGPNSGEFLLITDPEGDVTGDTPDLEVEGVKAWVHGIVGQDVRFIASGSVTTIELRYVTDADLKNRYATRGVDTRDPGNYNRTAYFDCLPGGG